MFEQAQANVDVLVQHGLSASALTQFEQWLDEFERMMALGAEARTRHTAATRELDVLTKEGLAIVRALDASLRLRYAGDRQLLEQWTSTRCWARRWRRRRPAMARRRVGRRQRAAM